MLKHVASILLSSARSHDIVARVGGDEFAVLLRGCDVRVAERIASSICTRVANHQLEWNAGVETQLLSVGASIGIVAIDAAFTSVAAVLKAADEACYDAKRAGRGTVRTYRRSNDPAELAVE